ncbi:uncharacterized protein G2W53_027104 [Senna tora]|uniref:Uncharacterized protein n=1 Tax=Senna tora TaxID=362788 RepID=A0A834TIC7_9FABA|nr:uncharacterized protein G2W53_027104 [Senna tora]
MTQGHLPRSFKAIRLEHGQIFDGRRRGSPSAATLKNQSPTAYDTRKPPKKFQGNPTCARPNLRWTTTWIGFSQGRLKINHPWVNFFSMQNLSCTCTDKMIPVTQGSRPRSFKAIRVGRPAVDHVDRRPSKINASWVNFFSMQNPKCILWVKMKPMTQGNLPRSFKEIRLLQSQIFDRRRRGSPSVGDA